MEATKGKLSLSFCTCDIPFELLKIGVEQKMVLIERVAAFSVHLTLPFAVEYKCLVEILTVHA